MVKWLYRYVFEVIFLQQHYGPSLFNQIRCWWNGQFQYAVQRPVPIQMDLLSAINISISFRSSIFSALRL